MTGNMECKATERAGRDGQICSEQQAPLVTQPHVGACDSTPVIRPGSNLFFALCVTFCANPVFGLIAMVFSMMSSSKSDDGDIDTAKRYSRVSLILCIIGIIISAILAVTLFIVLYLIPEGQSS